MHSSQARRSLIAHQSGEHCHNHAQILIGWRGKIDCAFHQGASRLDHGRIAIAPHGAKHVFRGLNDDSELLVIDVAPMDPYVQALEQACNISFNEALFQQAQFISLPPESLPLVEFAAGQLLNNKQPTNPQVNCQLISLFLTQLCQTYAPELTQPSIQQRLDSTRLNHIIDHCLNEPPTNPELAARMHLSESHFYYLCQRQFAMTPQQYVMQRRMQRAQYLLNNTNMPLAIVATELGFSAASSFSRAYKNHYQQTPSDARRAVKFTL